MTPPPPTPLAILDDYAAIAPPHFSNLPCPLEIHPLPLPTPTNLDDLAQTLHPYAIISTLRERTPFPATLLARLPNLKLLLNAGTRNASIDLEAARAHGVIVTGTKGDVPAEGSAERCELDALVGEAPPVEGHSPVIQLAFAQLLAMLSRVPRDDRLLRAEPAYWQEEAGMMTHVSGKVLGVVGLGKLGTQMARVGVQGFGMRVLAWSENLTQARADAVAAAGAGLGITVTVVGKEELFRRADVVSLHVVLSARTRGMVGARELGWMKPTAVIVNTARAGLVEEAALRAVLREGRIRGACLDVFWEEPLPGGSEWRDSAGWKGEVLMSPHMGYVTAWQMHRWYQEQRGCVEKWLAGEDVGERRMN
ncbi:hypothetical protein EJ03DRAFT_373818 [Teratosphaeria nubilosa]|uniref:D-isomer specific 2-hydroxyacid dehydrogenase NAD-binding domain-containing protein n=1 Tax=Teratosphaeria nubilosa TaxID=161662 RepID=A0A6G1LBE9_9PEZI|nr:hypothetical protein EJ03DRAFT_373818 [Teratosphaeria nubilosa]